MSGGILLRGSACSASTSIEKYKNNSLQTIDYTPTTELSAQWELIGNSFRSFPLLAMVNDTQADPAMLAYPPHPASSGRSVIAIGKNMYARILASEKFANEIMLGCLAHEFGHGIQFSSSCFVNLHRDENGDPYSKGKCLQNLTMMNGSRFAIELHADFLAGWFLGKKGLLSVDNFAGFSKFLFELGDMFFGTSGHHGTPRQRLNAMAAGWVFGATGKVVGTNTIFNLKSQRRRVDNSKISSAFDVGQAVVADFIGGCTTDECWF